MMLQRSIPTLARRLLVTSTFQRTLSTSIAHRTFNIACLLILDGTNDFASGQAMHMPRGQRHWTLPFPPPLERTGRRHWQVRNSSFLSFLSKKYCLTSSISRRSRDSRRSRSVASWRRSRHSSNGHGTSDWSGTTGDLGKNGGCGYL